MKYQKHEGFLVECDENTRQIDYDPVIPKCWTLPMPFPRNADALLTAWFNRPGRKPLVLRGARQTGKTTAVRRLAEAGPQFLELNLERHDDLSLIRTCHSARDLLERLQQKHNLASLPKDTLIFLDEVQEHPEALKWLRFFYEDSPELAVVAAGSLLEVRLREETLPFPVGRVEFLRLEPLTFLEFLNATADQRIAGDLRQSFGNLGRAVEGVDEGLHALAMERLREFLLVGGLPEAVEVWRTTRNLIEVRRVHDALNQAYIEDLLKYGVRTGTRHLEAVLGNAPAHYGARFKVRNLAPGEKDRRLSDALNLLEKAMVLYRVRPTSSRSLPLIPRSRAAHKLLPLDIGLALSQLSVRPEHLAGRAIETLMEGRLAEAFAGVQLLAASPEQSRRLCFWVREGHAKSNAEVDYLVPSLRGVLPVEVKSGAAGSLRSLHRFLAEAEGKLGIRLSARPGGRQDLHVNLGQGRTLEYQLQSLPLYLAELVATLE